jgi:restriction endonuclease Mrr
MLKISPDMVYKIDPILFEEIIYSIYSLFGYNAELTKRSHDGGADILIWSNAPIIGNDFLTIIQAKKLSYNKKVGAPIIRDLYGAKFNYNAERAQCITTYGFTKEAINTSKRMNIDLILFNELVAKIK